MSVVFLDQMTSRRCRHGLSLRLDAKKEVLNRVRFAAQQNLAPLRNNAELR